MLKRFLTPSFLFKGALIVVSLFLLNQLIPLGKNHENPQVVNEPQWNSSETRTLFERACFDCHSNETKWPWYSKIAPMSWMVQMDVNKARSSMNFSEWDTSNGITAELIAKKVRNNEMPLPRFLMLNPEARLSQAEKEKLIQGIHLTLVKP